MCLGSLFHDSGYRSKLKLKKELTFDKVDLSPSPLPSRGRLKDRKPSDDKKAK